MKTCSKCNESLPLDEFYRHATNKDGRKGSCKSCWNAQQNAYAKGPGKSARRDRRMLYLAQRKDLVDEIKSAPCEDCGKIYPPYVMDFDHRDPSEKEFGISEGRKRVNSSVDRLLAEIAKCDVVCSNCHRERTHSRL